MKRENHYVNHLNYSSQERLAGLFVLGALALIVVLLVFGSGNMQLLQGRIEYVALMRNPAGITTDTPVHISGIEAGMVKRIALTPDNHFKIVLSVYKEYQSLVRTDSTASISKLALIGDTVINISPGSPHLPLLADGGAIEVEETLTLDQMLSSLRPMLDKINLSIERVAAILGAVPEGAVGSILEDTAAVASQLRQGGGAAGALVYDERMRRDLAAALRALRETLGRTSEIAGDSRDILRQLGETADILHQQMQSVPEMTARTRDLIDETRKTVDAIGNTWPVSANMPAMDEPEGPEVMASND